jgi:formamidopyrimidine-DNA glycosylase
MPELPDLQAFSYNLTKKLQGKKLEKVIVTVDKKLNVTTEKLQDTLAGNEVKKLIRAGKELHVQFKGGHTLGLHLMLHGGLSIFKDGEEQPKFQIITLVFKDGTCLALTDFQKAATPTLDPETSKIPDALDIDENYLAEKLGKTKTLVKTVLMDQKVLRGIGNAYADEILWHARISPFSPSNKIPAKNVKTLYSAIKKTLDDAEKQILKANPDIISGEVRDFLIVHQPRKKQTPAGVDIHQKEVGGRKTYYTGEQELFE